MQIWPAIDLRGGMCVRLRQGDYNQETVFGDDPLAMAQQWADQGARYLHLVDLDGAREGRWVNRDAVEAIVQQVPVDVELGGGIRSRETIETLLELGLNRLVIGTRALADPDWLTEMCQAFPNRLVVGIDARDGQVATDGWYEVSSVSALELAGRVGDLPLAAIVYTDIAQDGMLAGPNLSAMAEMVQATGHPVIASGGVTTVEDVRQLAATGVAGCIIGRSLYEGKLTLAEALAAAEQGAA